MRDSAFAAVPAMLGGLVSHYRAELDLPSITHAKMSFEFRARV